MEDIPGMYALLEWLQSLGCGWEETPAVAPLDGDGSDRKFYRITAGRQSYIGLVSPRHKPRPAVDENDSYLTIGRHLHGKRLPVPRILYADTENGRFLLEDAGDLHLQKYALYRRNNLRRIYGHVLALLVALHGRAAQGFSTEFCFDASLYDPAFVYDRELEYFRKSFLNGYLGLGIESDTLRLDFENLAERAGVLGTSFVFHRDLQSRNIMVSRNRLWLIDFQGMRFGPPEYDLASLLLDPYVRLPAEVREEFVRAYWSGAGRRLGYSRGVFLKRYASVRLCRNLQVLGAFGFLGIVKGKRHFLDYVPWAWKQLFALLSGSMRGQFPRLERIVFRIGLPGPFPVRAKM